jgi:hypothetical protein
LAPPRTGELKPVLPTLPSTRSLEIQADDWNPDRAVQVEARGVAREQELAHADDVASRDAGQAGLAPSSPAALGVTVRKARAEGRVPSREPSTFAREPLERVTNKPDAGVRHAVREPVPGAAAVSDANSASSEATKPADKPAGASAGQEPVPSPFRVRPPRSQEF